MRFAILAVSILIAATSPFRKAEGADRPYLSNPDGGEIRALIIGIDAYEHVRMLKGSTADARDIETSLRTMGTSDVTILIDSQADRNSVLLNISKLVQRTNPNDLVLLSIAGHGAQEPERVKGSEPDGLEDVFLLSGFEPTPLGSQQRILGSEFNHFIRQFELRGARVLFVADTCHGGGMARDIDPRAVEMSFRQVPKYSLPVDMLKPVTDEKEPPSDLDLDKTAFVAAVDRNTKAPEVHIPGVDGLRGALSFAIARALEGSADANHDGKVTLKELFENVRQVVYQISDQRQNVVTKTSPGHSLDTEVVFQLAHGLDQQATSSTLPVTANRDSSAAAKAAFAIAEKESIIANRSSTLTPGDTGHFDAPVRLAALDGKTSYFANLKSRDTTIEVVSPIDNPDLIWDPSSRDVIAWGDVVAYHVDQDDLAAVIDRTAAIKELKKIAIGAPQPMRIGPDDSRYHDGQTVQIELPDITGRSLVLFNVSGDGAIQMLYPIASDTVTNKMTSLRLPLRVRGPFGAEQIVAITSTRRATELEQALARLDKRRAPGQLVKDMLRYFPDDARVGSIGFFSAP